MATSFMGHPVRLALDVGAVVELAFEDDPDNAQPRAETEWIDEGIRFRLFNFGDTPGRGSKEPAMLGQIDEAFLFFHFRAFRWGTGLDYTVHYTFYTVPADAVSWGEQAES
jgi:hypothetical protein